MAESKKTEFTQGPAQGGHEDETHAKNVEEEAKAHGYTPVMVSGPNNNQGGN